MYSELFKLKEPPFRLSPDPEFLFASKQHSRAKAYMESTIWLADGFVVITGEIGAGKTTLIESFLRELPPDVILAHVNQTQLTPIEFLQSVLVEFGFHEFHERKVELLAKLKEFMVEQYSQGKTLLLIIDEAQNLSHKVLEELRLLSGIESQKEKPLRIILAGQPELADKLDSVRLEQLRQRIRLRFHLSTLSRRETGEYIQHRLDVAGANGRKIFDKDAVDLIFRYSGGVPRLINVLCDTAMLCGFSEEKDTVDVGLVSEAVNELQWVEYSQRNENRGLYSASKARRPATRLRLLEPEEDEDRSQSAAREDPAQPSERRPAPAQPTTSKPTPAQPTTSKPTPAQPPTSKPAPAQPPTSKPAPAQPTTSKPAPAQHGESLPPTAAARSKHPDSVEQDANPETARRPDRPEPQRPPQRVDAEPEANAEPSVDNMALARFDVLFRDQHITEFPLLLGRSIIGRTGENDLQIRSRFISRHHLQVITDERQCVAEDLNSTNGTFINTKPVKQHLLLNGDVIQLGEHKLVYRDLRDATASSGSALRIGPGLDNYSREVGPHTKEEDFTEFEGITTEVYESEKSN